MRTVLLVATLSLSCASAPRGIPTGSLSVNCQPDEAEVYIDERYIGTCALARNRAFTVAAGLRRVEVRGRGLFTQYLEVSVAANQPASVEVELRRSPDA